MKRNALNGKTIAQNKQSAMHKVIMNAAATFRTFGHLSNASTVNEFPQIPTIIIKMVATAAKFNNGRPNLKTKNKKHIKKTEIIKKQKYSVDTIKQWE